MFKFDSRVDNKEAMALEMRKKREEDRKNRIFNAKVRQIGVDTKSLEAQIKEKQLLEEEERRREEAYAADAVRNDRVAQLLRRREEEERRRVERATNDFRHHYQQAQCRREFELNDADLLKRELPARTSDHDPRCGPASIQKFEGEDLHYEERKRQQNEQLKNWVEQQAREKRTAQENQKLADRMYDNKVMEVDRRAVELQRAEEECRRSIQEANTQYNKALLKEQMIKNAYKKRQDEEDKRTEIANHLYGDFLTENPEAATSAFGFHRVMPDRWKGMTEAEVAEVRRQQEIQRNELQKRRCEEANLQQEHDNQQLAQARAVALMAREEEERRRMMQRQLADDNKNMAALQRQQQLFLNHDFTSNQPSPAFFAQFNTSTR